MLVVSAYASEPHRIMISIDPHIPTQLRSVAMDFEMALHKQLDQVSHIEIVANPQERELLLKELEFIFSDINADADEVDLEWRGEEKILLIKVSTGLGNEGYRFHIALLSLETAYKNSFNYNSTSGDIETSAYRLAQEIKSHLAPRGTVQKWISKNTHQVMVDIGRSSGIEIGMTLLAVRGKRQIARLKIIRTSEDESVAEVESGWKEIDVGSEVYVQVSPTDSNEVGKLIVSGPVDLNGVPVYIDNERKGTLQRGRFEIDLWRGEHQVELRGSKNFSKKVYVEEVSLVSVEWPGSIFVKSITPARVSVRAKQEDSWRSLGNTNRKYELANGEYHVRVSKDGYLPHVAYTSIDAGIETKLVVDLQRISGMVIVKGGKILLGREGELTNPPHWVATKSFYIDVREVTVEQFMDVFPHFQPPVGYPRDVAVSSVSWRQANEYCESLGKRLPTEAEWEQACLGKKKYKFSYGTQYDVRLTDARVPAEARQYPLSGVNSNDLGIFDMTGGVWEWTSETEIAAHLGGDSDTHMPIRGGAWKMVSEPERCASCVYRRKAPSQINGLSTIGFRCVLDKE